jgi:hypothetical protein
MGSKVFNAARAFDEIEAVAERALRDDSSRLGDYIEEIKHLAFTGARRERDLEAADHADDEHHKRSKGE